MSSNAESGQDRFLSSWRLQNSYADLPKVLYEDARPITVKSPAVVIFNQQLADELGLDCQNVNQETLASLFAGQTLLPNSRPIAQAYAGHQYGHFTMLGDGRAMLLGEQLTPSGKPIDVQLKGSGPTRFSRRGDGRAALGPMLREYVISEAMQALEIPTTRSLAVVTTGESVVRETLLRGAILTRTADSHIRVGTFQYLAALKDVDNLRALADYTIRRHYPELIDQPNRYRELLRAVIDRQAQLISQWQLVGFVHGVMNTDNMAVCGETIDYGPCAFMDTYDPETVFSSIDDGGRYAYVNQPGIAQWNLARFAETLLPLIDTDTDKAIEQAMELLSQFPTIFEGYWLVGMRVKLGLAEAKDTDSQLIHSLLELMLQHRADYTRTFAQLSRGQLGEEPLSAEPFQSWLALWRARLAEEAKTPESAAESMRRVNPAVIARNHQVEKALTAAEENDDLAPFQALLRAVQSPFSYAQEFGEYESPPPSNSAPYRTFCGT